VCAQKKAFDEGIVYWPISERWCQWCGAPTNRWHSVSGVVNRRLSLFVPLTLPSVPPTFSWLNRCHQLLRIKFTLKSSLQIRENEVAWPLLWSQFSAIFANFQRKIGVFSKTNVVIKFL
jgi:hypothetical protein